MEKRALIILHFNMKKLLTLIILIPCISIAQWNYGNTSKGKGVYANGKIEFREFEDFEFKLVKYKDVDIDFSISSEYFKESSGYYYVVLRVLDKNFRVLEFEIVDGNYKILELKDIAKNDKYKVEDFLKIFRKDISCIVTIKNNNKIIQGFSSLEGGLQAINYVLMK